MDPQPGEVRRRIERMALDARSTRSQPDRIQLSCSDLASRNTLLLRPPTTRSTRPGIVVTGLLPCGENESAIQLCSIRSADPVAQGPTSVLPVSPSKTGLCPGPQPTSVLRNRAAKTLCGSNSGFSRERPDAFHQEGSDREESIAGIRNDVHRPARDFG